MDESMQEQNVSKRINVTLPDAVAELLEKWADHEGRPTANLAAFIIEKTVREAESEGKFPANNAESQSIKEQKKR